MQSVLPVNDCYGMFNGHTSRWQVVKQINDLLEPLAVKEGAAILICIVILWRKRQVR